MHKELVQSNLADRTEAILRKDRRAFQAVKQPVGQHLMLALLPDDPEVIDFMDSYIAPIADELGLSYMQPQPTMLDRLPLQYLERSRLVVAEISGQEEMVARLVYQVLRLDRPVLLLCRSDEIPGGLAHLPSVRYDLFEPDLSALEEAILEVLVLTEP